MCPIYMQGIGQMTPAQTTLLRKAQNGMRSNGSRSTKKRKVKSTAGGTKKVKRRASGKGKSKKRLVKGSAEAKKYMAKIRKMRK